MKKKLVFIAAGAILFLFFLIFVVILGATVEEDEKGNQSPGIVGEGGNLSPEVLAYKDLVVKYAREFGIEEYVPYLLAIMEVESGGRVPDVMQSSASAGLRPNTLGPEESIKQGCYYFSGLLADAEEKGCDILTAIQSYNYGGSFTNYVVKNGGAYTLELAESFAYEKSGGNRVPYSDPLAVAHNGGYRYTYGNMFYVQKVLQYVGLPGVDDATVQAIFNEALKYQGWPYVFGGSSPTTSFDCSGLTQWCFAAAGISLPRTAQEQYEATQHISLEEAVPGDLIFFQGTYNTANYITHVGIVRPEGRKLEAEMRKEDRF